MATTRQNLRRGLSDLMGDFIRDPDGAVPTCSSQGGASGVTAIDALLSYYEDDYFNDWYFVLPVGPTSGSTAYEVTRVADFTQSTGTLTLEPDASLQIDNGRTYELHRYNPASKHLALNAARLQSVDALWAPKVDETLVVDNIVTNWDFENWDATGGDSAVATSWTNIGSPQNNDEATRLVHGSYSIKIAASGATEGIEQNVLTINPTAVNIHEIENKTLHVRAWVWASVADAARVRVTYDGSTYDNSNYHSGSSEWEGPGQIFIDSTIDMPASGEELTISLEVTAGNTAYFDVITAWIDPIIRYALPTGIHRWPSVIKQQVDRNRPGINGDFAHLTRVNRPVSGQILRVEGKGVLTEVTGETGEMEVSDPETQLLYAEALDWLVDHDMGSASTDAQLLLERDKARWQRMALRMRSRGGIARIQRVQYPDGIWDIASSGETEYIMMKR